MDEDEMGVNDLGRLYWDGKPIEIVKTFSLNRWQTAIALLTLVAALLAGSAAALSAYVTWQQWRYPHAADTKRA